MSEKTLKLEGLYPPDIFGLREEKLQLIRNFFPKLSFVSRGELLILLGEEDDIKIFEEKFAIMLHYHEQYGKLPDEKILEILTSGHSGLAIPEILPSGTDDLILYGKNGMLIKARTPNQRKMVDSFEQNDMLFAIGPAGTGKTYTAVALAVKALKNKEVKRIILTRPAVEAGENLGFLPGDLRDKLDPYLQPLYDALKDMIPPAKLAAYLEDGTIEIAPLAFMRGRTLDNAFAILDEAQNATENQLKMFLTRMGKSAKFIITGDITQIDLPKNQVSGLITASKLLHNVKGISFVFLNEKDVVRHPLVTKIIEAYEKNQEPKIMRNSEAKAKIQPNQTI